MGRVLEDSDPFAGYDPKMFEVTNNDDEQGGKLENPDKHIYKISEKEGAETIVITDEEGVIEIQGENIMLGRQRPHSHQTGIMFGHFLDSTISRSHVKLTSFINGADPGEVGYGNYSYHIKDLNSSNGTFVNKTERGDKIILEGGKLGWRKLKSGEGAMISSGEQFKIGERIITVSENNNGDFYNKLNDKFRIHYRFDGHT